MRSTARRAMHCLLELGEFTRGVLAILYAITTSMVYPQVSADTFTISTEAPEEAAAPRPELYHEGVIAASTGADQGVPFTNTWNMPARRPVDMRLFQPASTNAALLYNDIPGRT